MADLQDIFEDYLVSYKVPDKKVEAKKPKLSEFPDRFKQYISSKSNKPTTEPTTESSESTLGFTGWTYDETPIVSSNEWINTMREAYSKLNLSDNAIRNLIAKNALESNYGQSVVGNYNYGNITTGSSWKGDYVEGKDKDENGNEITNRFRSYANLDDFVADEVQFLTTLYDFNQDDDINTFLDKLQGNNKGKRKYAQAPDYSSRVRSVYYRI